MNEQTVVTLNQQAQSQKLSLETVIKALAFSQQHQVYISKELHKKLPETWLEKRPSEQNFYLLLLHHLETPELFTRLDNGLSELIRKKPTWRKILSIRSRLLGNAIDRLIHLDYEGCKTLLKSTPRDDAFDELSTKVLSKLSTCGEPEYQQFFEWIETRWKDYLPNSDTQKHDQDPHDRQSLDTRPNMVTVSFLQDLIEDPDLQATMMENLENHGNKPFEQIWEQCLCTIRHLASAADTPPDEILSRQLLLKSVIALWAASEYQNSLNTRLTRELEKLLQRIEENVGNQQPHLIDTTHRLRQFLPTDELELDQGVLTKLSVALDEVMAAYEACKQADRQVDEAFEAPKRDRERLAHLTQQASQIEQRYRSCLQSLIGQLQGLIPTDSSLQNTDEPLLTSSSVIEPLGEEPPQKHMRACDPIFSREPESTVDEAPVADADAAENQAPRVEIDLVAEEDSHPTEKSLDTKPETSMPDEGLEEGIESDIEERYPTTTLQVHPTPISSSPTRDESHWDTLNKLIWSMIDCDRVGLAHHLALTVHDGGEASPDVHPDLLKALALAPLVRSSIGEVVTHLQQLFQNLLLTYDFQSKDIRQQDHLVLLAFAATLRPALLAPQTSGAFTVLETLPLNESFDALYQLRQSVVDYVYLRLELTPALLKGTSERSEWQKGLQALQVECRDWWHRNRLRKLKYHPTTQVWRLWLEPEGILGKLLTTVLENRRQQYEEVRDAIAQYSRKDQVEDLLDRTDKTIRKGAAAKKPIEGHPRQEIFNHTQDALQFCKRWLGQIDSEPRGNDGNRQTDHYRQQLIINLQKAREDLNTRYSRDDTRRQAALVATHRAIDNLTQLLDPSIGEETPPPVWEVLHAELLKLPQLHLDQDWKFQGKYADPVHQATLLPKLVQNNPNWETLFNEHCMTGNLAAAELILDLLERSTGDREKLEMEINRTRERNRRSLDADKDAAHFNLERATADDLLNETERLQHLETIENILIENVEDFRLPREKLQAINDEIDCKRRQRADEIQRRLEKTGIRGIDPELFQRITTLLATGDLLTTNEYISLLEAGKKIPESIPTRQPLEDYFPNFVKEIHNYLGVPSHAAQLIQDVKNQRKVGPLEMQRVPKAQAKSAADMFSHWHTVKKSLPSTMDLPALRGVLEGLGFRVERLTPIEGSAANQIAWFQLQTQPLADQNTCVIPRYGSLAQGSYRILGLWGRPSEEEILADAAQYGLDMPIIVFYFGRMTEQRRRSLAWICRERRQKLLVLDDTLLLFLCQERGLRLSVMFQCTFPFTVENPYITTSSDVPVEMFFGRKRARDDIFDRSGTNLVYGGRQLGKTALLRDVARQHHQFEKGVVVRWIDLKAKDIGLNLPPGDIWTVIGDSLREFEIISNRVRTRERIIEDIRNWLLVDQQRRVLLLLDEADAFLYKDSKEDPSHPYAVVNSLKNLMEQTHRRFKVVFAGLHNVQRFSRDINTPIAHLGTPICIGPLLQNGEIHEALQLVKRPLEILGYQVPDEVAHRILSHTNYYPSLIQLFCRHLLEHLNETPFDLQTSPPYRVTSQHVEDAFQQRELRRAIADRFKLTLDLDARYRLIALLIALASLEGRQQQTAMEGVNVTWVKEQALNWWRPGFEDTSYDAFNTILDEMVGLGILRYSGPDGQLYTLRSPNVINLLGTKDEIEQMLLDASEKEPPLIYDAETFRRQVKNNVWVRSPLTGQQESELYRTHHGVMLLFGMPIAGIGDVVTALRPVASQGRLMEKHPENLLSFERDMERIFKDRAEGGTMLVVIPASVPWREEWVSCGREMLERKRAHSATKYRLLFIGDPGAAWRWTESIDSKSVGKDRQRERRDSLELLTLKPWHDNAFRQWLSEVNFGQFDDSSKRSEFIRITGGWNGVLTELGHRIRQERSSLPWDSKLAELEKELQNKSDWFGQLGLVPEAMPTIQLMANLNVPIQESILEDLVESETPARIRQVLRWGDLLGIIQQTGRQEWQLNEFIAHQIRVHGD